MSSFPVITQNELNTNRWGEQSRRDTFPCENPTIPQMRSLTTRKNTYGGRFQSDLAAPVSDLADAGLYYLGSEDRTKCFYCGGCLMNWKHKDDPMEEHAKWFPECEYVLRKRGCEYVTSISEKYPDIVRPDPITHHRVWRPEPQELFNRNLEDIFPSMMLNGQSGMVIRWWI